MIIITIFFGIMVGLFSFLIGKNSYERNIAGVMANIFFCIVSILGFILSLLK